MTGPGPHPARPTGEEKVNVLIVNLHTEMGGGEYALYDTLRSLDRTRVRPVMLFNRQGSFPDRLRDLGIDTIILPFPAVMLRELVSPPVLAAMLKASCRMHRLLREERIDVVQCSDVLTLLLLALPVLARRVPVIFCVIFFYEWTRMLLFNLLAAVLVEKIVANSPAVARDVQQKTMMLGRKVEVVEPGVDSAVFHPPAAGEPNRLRSGLGLPEWAKLVGMAARFEPGKGHMVFLRAAAQVARLRRDVVFLVIGAAINADMIPSLRAYQESVVAECARLGLTDRVRFLGYRGDMPEVLRSLDLVVVPSEQEGFGLIILESLASGVPVVISPAVGAWERVRDFPGVATARTGDAESFSDAMVNSLAGQRPAAGLASTMTWRAAAERFEILYESYTKDFGPTHPQHPGAERHDGIVTF